MYVPLNIKTDNYLKNSMIKIEDLIKFAKEKELSSLTITDNNMYGVIDFYKACKNNDIKPIIGLEVNIENNIVLYAKGYEGYLNLIKLATIQSEGNINIDCVKKYRSDLVLIIPYESKNLYEELKDYYNDIFISYKNNEEKDDIKVNKVYMNSINYINKNNFKYMKYLEALKDGISVRFIETDYKDNYLKAEEEIIKDDINNNYYINSICNLEIKFNNDLIPRYKNDKGLSSFEYLKKLCIQGAKKRFGSSISKKYQERLKYELSIINNMGFSDYFLIVADYVNFAKDNNIIVGTGRGSAVSSLVSYLLNITDVDPLKYDLLFERFLNPSRISMPDIDIDFEHNKRDLVIDYCTKKYGNKKVAQIIAFGTMGAKAAIRDIGRCLDIDLKLVDSLCKLLDSRLSLNENYKQNKKLQEFLKRKQELFDLYKDAIHFEGLKRHTTIHAAGVVMSNTDLDNIIPLDLHDDFYTSGYDMTYLEEIGLLKMDFLAIKYLTTIHNIIDLINNNHNTNLTFDNIVIDTDSINIFKNADTLGIFQFESSGMMNFLSKLKPDSIDDIIASIALYRPGPMKNIDTYIRRKQNQEKIDYMHPTLEPTLKSTYGIIIYQEQIMQIARIMADYSLSEADILRKAMSKKKKELVENQRETFIKRSISKGYDINTINKVFDTMIKFAEYGFNKSHSVGYSMVALKMAYLKAHYRKEFYSCLIESERVSKEKVKQYVFELRKANIKVLGPDINLSGLNYNIISNDIIYPLSNIKGLNTNIANTIIDIRKERSFKDIYDFVSRCYGKIVNRKVIETLILAGCFDNMKINRKTLIDNLDIILNYGELLHDVGEYALMPEIEYKPEYKKAELMNFELEYFGFYLGNNPVTIGRQKYKNTIDLKNLSYYFNKEVNMVVLVDQIRKVTTKNKDSMAFLECSDEISSCSVVIFPEVYKKYNINKNDIIYLRGKVEKRYDKYQVIASHIEEVNIDF